MQTLSNCETVMNTQEDENQLQGALHGNNMDRNALVNGNTAEMSDLQDLQLPYLNLCGVTAFTIWPKYLDLCRTIVNLKIINLKKDI